MNVPFGFDANFYRSRYSDLARLSPEEARAHFASFGIAEGRQGAPLGCRATFADDIRARGRILEIGPFCNPIFAGENVRYLDVLDADGLRARAETLGRDTRQCPERIHYVGDLDQVDETFDAVVSSHAIEHQPDLLRHLSEVARVLRPGIGRYYLFVPDKRYCFDHFVPETTIAEVIQAHLERRTRHIARSVIEHIALRTHNDAARHWAGDHGAQHPPEQVERIHHAMAVHEGSDTYVDVHAWYFMPTNFWTIMEGLHACGMTPLRPVAIYPTLRNELEFFAVLERPAEA